MIFNKKFGKNTGMLMTVLAMPILFISQYINTILNAFSFKEILLSDSSESSDEENDPITDDDFKQMLRVHKEQKLRQLKFFSENNVST